MLATSGRPPVSSRVIRVGGALGLLPLLRERGVDPHAFFVAAGLPIGAFDHPDNVVPFASLCRLLHIIANGTGLVDIGVRTCVHTGLRSLGTVGYLAAHARTVGEALVSLKTFLHLHDEGATPFVIVEHDTAVLGYEVLEPGLPGADQIAFGALAIAANLLREICGPTLRLREVTFAFRAPSDLSAFRAHFAAPMHFNRDRNGVAFDASFLERPIASADAILRDLLTSQVREKDRAGSGDVAKDRIRRVMRTLLASGRAGQSEVASAFGMSRRTLARRIEESGTTFRALLDESRFDAARGLLEASSASFGDIASKLGYADATAFARAFRRWSGSSPAAWRRTHRRY